LYYHAIIDPKSPQLGIQELRYLDPRKIRKVREVKRAKDVGTPAPIVKTVTEYFIYNERGFNNRGTNTTGIQPSTEGIKIAKDSIVHVTSGLLNQNSTMVLSYLHKAIKPLNQLRTLEDATVIYRLSRAPERRIFYIDVGNLPKMKAEQYLRDMMVRHKNKIVYDSATGEVRDDRKFMTMLEDYWLPRREGGRGTEITTLPGGQNLGQIEDVQYFQKNLYKSLNVPITRLDEQAVYSLGRATEITRDEVKFAKFISRIRIKFCAIFLDCLEKQLVLKGVMNLDEWRSIAQDIRFEFAKDNLYSELKEIEIQKERFNLIATVDPFVGKYFSIDWVKTNVLKQDEEEKEKIDSDINMEKGMGLYTQPGMDAVDPTMDAPPGSAPPSGSGKPAAKPPAKKPAAKSKPKSN
jgi:polyhydroxyalkanoate synthesis regulator phasin